MSDGWPDKCPACEYDGTDSPDGLVFDMEEQLCWQCGAHPWKHQLEKAQEALRYYESHNLPTIIFELKEAVADAERLAEAIRLYHGRERHERTVECGYCDALAAHEKLNQETP